MPSVHLSRPDKCAAKLLCGEAKRTPPDRKFNLIGYYIGCPSCAKVNAIPYTHQTFEEHEDGTASMNPGHKCQCGCEFSINHDEIIFG
jgi:hypothetical protein